MIFLPNVICSFFSLIYCAILYSHLVFYLRHILLRCAQIAVIDLTNIQNILVQIPLSILAAGVSNNQ